MHTLVYTGILCLGSLMSLPLQSLGISMTEEGAFVFNPPGKDWGRWHWGKGLACHSELLHFPISG